MTSTNNEDIDVCEESWQDLLGITADPPEHREKCEDCK